jgi:outer membrane protein assembly factor BamB
MNEIVYEPAVTNDLVYFGSYGGKIFVFDATCRATCQPLWIYQARGPIFSALAIANGLVYFGSYDNRTNGGSLYAFDATCSATCQPLWQKSTNEGIGSSLAVVNGVLYIGGADGTFYMFGLPNLGS